ncbi:MAG: nuclear transport factor 2 family protein [Myxococcota bacterium]|nr:nuclear transport factor 2 family protein [Myxococcota bacterium]
MKNRVEDVAAVRGVINAYIEGSKGDAELLRSIFHSDAGMNGYFSGQLLIGSPEPFFAEVAKIDSSAPQGNYRAEIESIEVIGDVASATLVEQDFLGSGFVDFFHLIRVEGDWKIISKTYHQDS